MKLTALFLTTAAADCGSGCPNHWIGDNWCDPSCNTAACGNDGGDCDGITLKTSGMGSGAFVFAGSGSSMLPPPPTFNIPTPTFNIPTPTVGSSGPAINFGGSGMPLIASGAGSMGVSSGGCANGCPTAWVNDGWCDDACNNEACQFDGQDCATAATSSSGPAINFGGSGMGLRLLESQKKKAMGGVKRMTPNPKTKAAQLLAQDCGSGCPNHWIGDNWCDPSCNTAACGNDGGDCDGITLKTSGMGSGAFVFAGSGSSMLPPPPTFNIPTPTFNIPTPTVGSSGPAINFGGSGMPLIASGAGSMGVSSGGCANGCPTAWVNDGWCDDACNNEACQFDGQDCATAATSSSGPAINFGGSGMGLRLSAQLLAHSASTATHAEDKLQSLGFGYVAAACLIVVAAVPAMRALRKRDTYKPLLSSEQSGYRTDIL